MMRQLHVFLLICLIFFCPLLSNGEDFSSINSLITGSYLGEVGKTHLTIPLARFFCKGNEIEGWMLIDHPDFFIKQNFKGKINSSTSDSKGIYFRQVSIDLIGVDSEIAYLSPEFQKRLNEIFSSNKNMRGRIEDLFIRQFSFSAFIWEGETDSIVFSARLGQSSFSHQFPLVYYPLVGNLYLTKIKGNLTFEDLRKFKERLRFSPIMY